MIYTINNEKIKGIGILCLSIDENNANLISGLSNGII